jgi:hypothetical protein
MTLREGAGENLASSHFLFQIRKSTPTIEAKEINPHTGGYRYG